MHLNDIVVFDYIPFPSDGDAIVNLFNGRTNVVIDYLFILLTNCVCLYLSFDFDCVIVAGIWPAPVSCFTGALCEFSKQSSSRAQKYCC